MSTNWNTFGAGVAITPSDTLDRAFKALWIGGTGGTVAVVPEGGEAATSFTVATNTLLPVGGRRVNATGTTATLIVGLQ